MEGKESNIREIQAEKIGMSLQFCRTSGIYAGEDFTAYIKVENISSESLYIWNYGVLPSTEFEFRSYHFEQLELSEGTRLERFIFYIKSIKLRIKKEYSEYKLKNKLEESLPLKGPLPLKEPLSFKEPLQDSLKIYYTTPGNFTPDLPWELSPGESVTCTLMGTTKKSLLFRPDKYNLLTYVDYCDSQKVFCRETKVAEISVFTSIRTLIVGAAIGGLLGGLSRLIINASGDLKAIYGNVSVIRENINATKENTNTLQGNVSALLENTNTLQENVSPLLENAKINLTNANHAMGGGANVLLANASVNLVDASTNLTKTSAYLENTSAILLNVNATLADASTNLTKTSVILAQTYDFSISFLIILLSVILSVFTVIALARKTGAQQLITIQDIWGGVFIGFLIGYFGNVVFDNLIKISGIT